MWGRTKSLLQAPLDSASLNLLIVARDQPELYERLHRHLHDPGLVMIVLDRRERERRQTTEGVPVDRRRRDRRSAAHPWSDLRRRQYFFARPPDRCPHD